ncbi:hypothetical protein KQI52_06110 [bacterium]|nr:hypothetical protein [bacterium]
MRVFLELLAVSVAIIIVGCSSSTQQEAGDNWLAIVGDDTITVNQYTYRYETAPHTGFGTTARRDFLDALIIERLLAHISADTSDRYTALRSQMTAEARVESFLIDRIDAEVDVPEAEIRANVLRAIRTLTVQAWAAPDSLTAARILAAYRDGTAFARAGNQSLSGAVYLDTVEVKWNTTDPALERLAYSLELDEAGGPIEVEGRWWVLRLVRFEQDRIPSESVYLELGPWVRDALEARQARARQPEIIADAMRGHTMDIDPDGWRWLVDALRKQLDSRDDPALQLPFTALEESSLRGLDGTPELDKPLLRVDGPTYTADWTRADVLHRLEVAPKPVLRFDDPRRFEHELHAHLRWLVEFEVLDELAREAGYETNPRVIRDSRMWSTHLSAREELNRQLSSITGVSDDTTARIGIPTDASADEQLLALFRDAATREGVRINTALLDTLSLIDVPVFVRKRHFPNRPATPLPVGQPWATEIDFPPQP